MCIHFLNVFIVHLIDVMSEGIINKGLVSTSYSFLLWAALVMFFFLFCDIKLTWSLSVNPLRTFQGSGMILAAEQG